MQWCNAQHFVCRGTKAAHEAAVQETLRDASLDPEARKEYEAKEEGKRKESAARQNRSGARVSPEEEEPSKTSKERAEPKTSTRSASSGQTAGKRASSVGKVDLEESGSDKDTKGSQAPVRVDARPSRATSRTPKEKEPAIYAEFAANQASASDRRAAETQKSSDSNQHVRLQGSDPGASSTNQRRPVELKPRDPSSHNVWKNYKRENPRTPNTSPRSRAISDERREPRQGGTGPSNQRDSRDQETKGDSANRGRSAQERVPSARSRTRSKSQSRVAKFQNLWNPRSRNTAMERDDLAYRLDKMFRKHGPAKDWPEHASVFTHEGLAFKAHIARRGWEQPHQLIWV